MDNNKEEKAMIPFVVHEAEVNRLERINKRFFILLIIIFLAFVCTNAGWIIYESQYEDVVVTQDVDTGSGDAAISGTGDVYYGADQTDSQNPAKENP